MGIITPLKRDLGVLYPLSVKGLRVVLTVPPGAL
jgi:hypothetical protein